MKYLFFCRTINGLPLVDRTHITLCRPKQLHKNSIKQFSIETAAVMDIHAVLQPLASATAGIPVTAERILSRVSSGMTP